MLPASARAATSHTYTDTLAASRVAASQPGELIVTLEGTGDIRGFLTLKLQVGADGAITGGDWALVSRYAEFLNADGTVDTTAAQTADESVPHQEFLRLVDNGTVSGHVTGGFVGANADGSPALANVQLQLTSGSLTFDGVTSGTGTLDADFSQTTAQGSLRLDF